MATKRLYHAKCNVRQCVDEDKSLFALPSTEPSKTLWLTFIFAGNVPKELPKNIHVCAKHFTEDCFHNLGQYRAGFAENLKLKPVSVPSLAAAPSATHGGQASTSSVHIQTPRSRDAACQTDRIVTHTAGTQLSLRTLQPHFRSEFVQATVPTQDFKGGTSDVDPLFLSSTPVKRLAKRPRLDLEEKLDDQFEGTSSPLTASMEQDSTYNPANIATTLDSTLQSLYLAAIHFNENANRPQAQTAEGVPLFKIPFPKSKKGECTVKPQKTKSTFGYVDVLMGLILDKVFANPALYNDALLDIHVPEDLSAQFTKPDREEVIASFVSRFTRGAV